MLRNIQRKQEEQEKQMRALEEAKAKAAASQAVPVAAVKKRRRWDQGAADEDGEGRSLGMADATPARPGFDAPTPMRGDGFGGADATPVAGGFKAASSSVAWGETPMSFHGVSATPSTSSRCPPYWPNRDFHLFCFQWPLLPAILEPPRPHI